MDSTSPGFLIGASDRPDVDYELCTDIRDSDAYVNTLIDPDLDTHVEKSDEDIFRDLVRELVNCLETNLYL